MFETLVSRFFPTAYTDDGREDGFDLWRLPNDPDSPHVDAKRDLFVATFRMPPEAFDAHVEPRQGAHRRLIVAARGPRAPVERCWHWPTPTSSSTGTPSPD